VASGVANVMLPHQYCPELLAKCACRRYWIVDNIPFLWHPDSLKVIPPRKKPVEVSVFIWQIS